jgi:hypothetical protein
MWKLASLAPNRGYGKYIKCESNDNVTYSMASMHVEYVTLLTKDYEYAGCERCLFWPLSH